MWLHTGYILNYFPLQFTNLYKCTSYRVFNTAFIEHNFYQFTSVTNTKCWIIHERFSNNKLITAQDIITVKKSSGNKYL